MMRLPNEVIAKVEDAKIEVFYADRGTTRYWNEKKSARELRFFTGWYWWVKGRNGKAASEEHGPFRSQMAAYRDGFHKMQMQLD